MAYFLRYTATPQEDLKRGTSLHVGATKNTQDAEFIDGIGWCIVLNGLCAHELDEDIDTEEDAIESAIDTVLYARKHYSTSPNYSESDVFSAYLFEGRMCGTVDDGVLFTPKKLICNISELA